MEFVCCCDVLFFLLILLKIVPCQPWIPCGTESNTSEDRYVCPNGNKCCLVAGDDDGQDNVWGCISGKNPKLGDCCRDDIFTGCGEGYECSQSDRKRCVNIQNETTNDPPILPRYKLCSIHHEYQRSTHYVPSGAAFLSSHSLSPQGLDGVEQLWIIVHGSGHNPEDYLCCSLALSEASRNIWIIAPWFQPSGSNSSGLKWIDHGPIAHTWRYGADAENSNISSYAVTDDLIKYALAKVPALQRIVVAGHSAGGQYVQRWALLTEVWIPSMMRAIVANPKSFCWLDARRMFSDGLRLPNQDAIAICPTYNEWEWGLENSTSQHRENGALVTPYKDAVLTEYTTDQVTARYLSRDVVYLSGELDILWNGDCEARMQGDSRKKRSENFFKSLLWQQKIVSHRRLVVKGVDHNHCLMFQSPEGREAFFSSSASSVLAQ